MDSVREAALQPDNDRVADHDARTLSASRSQSAKPESPEQPINVVLLPAGCSGARGKAQDAGGGSAKSCRRGATGYRRSSA